VLLAWEPLLLAGAAGLTACWFSTPTRMQNVIAASPTSSLSGNQLARLPCGTYPSSLRNPPPPPFGGFDPDWPLRRRSPLQRLPLALHCRYRWWCRGLRCCLSISPLLGGPLALEELSACLAIPLAGAPPCWLCGSIGTMLNSEAGTNPHRLAKDVAAAGACPAAAAFAHQLVAAP